jgi:hypothetical protein
MWASLCKSLPGEPTQVQDLTERDSPTLSSWSSCLTDFSFLLKHKSDPTSSSYHILEQEAAVIEPVNPNTAPVLCCLAVGGAGNEQAAEMYSHMMEYAQQKGEYKISKQNLWPQ